MHSITRRGTCVPPGLSKNTAPLFSAGNSSRIRSGSRGIVMPFAGTLAGHSPLGLRQFLPRIDIEEGEAFRIEDRPFRLFHHDHTHPREEADPPPLARLPGG